MIVYFEQTKRSKKGRKEVPRGAMGEQFEENPTVRARKRSNRRQGIYLKLKELNIVTRDHAYLEFCKSEKEGKPDLGTRKIVSTSKELALRSSLGEETITQSSFNESLLTAEQVSTFVTPSKRQTYLKKKQSQKKFGNRIGCDYRNQNGMDCSYWVHAMYMAFPDAEEKVLENITFDVSHITGKMKLL